MTLILWLLILQVVKYLHRSTIMQHTEFELIAKTEVGLDEANGTTKVCSLNTVY